MHKVSELGSVEISFKKGLPTKGLVYIRSYIGDIFIYRMNVQR